MTTGKTMALTRQAFVIKMKSLLFNMLSRFDIAFLPRSKHLNFMASATVQNDFWSPRKESLSLFPLFPHLFAMKKHKLESRLPGEISITSDMQMTPPLWQTVKRNSKAS